MKRIKTIFAKCKTNLGGVKQVFLSTHRDYKPYEVEKDKDELIKSVKRLFYVQKVSQSKFDESAVFDTSGNISFDLTLSFAVWDNQKYKGIVKELLNKKFDAVIQLHNGSFLYAGFQNGLELKTCTFQTGQIKSDLIGYNFSFKGMEEDPVLRFESMTEVGFQVIESDDLIFVLASGDNPIQVNNNLIQIV